MSQSPEERPTQHQPSHSHSASRDSRLVRLSLASALVAVGTVLAWILAFGGLEQSGSKDLALGLAWLTVFPMLLLAFGAWGCSVGCGLCVLKRRPVVLWWVLPLVLPLLATVAWVIIWNVQRQWPT